MNRRNLLLEGVTNTRSTPTRMLSTIFVIIGLLAAFSSVPVPTARGATVVFYDDDVPAVSYTGTWTRSTAYPKAYNDTLHWTNVAGASATVHFRGGSMAYVYTMAPGRGSVRVYIDGVLQETFSATASDTRFQVARTWRMLYGPHSIKIEAVGDGYIDLDAFIMDAPYATSATSSYDDISPLVNYIEGTTAWVHSFSYPSAYNATISQTNVQQNALSFTFYGDHIRYIFTKTPGRGKSVVTIDGVEKEVIGAYSSGTIWKYAIDYRGLGGDIHTIHISNLHQKNPASNGYNIDLDHFQLTNCPGDPSTCRAYAYADRSGTNTYNAIGADISYANPATASNGLSIAVLWIILPLNVIEVGWRKEPIFNSNPYLYWGYYDASGWHAFPLENNTRTHNFKLAHLTSTNKWHVFIDGADRGSVAFSSGTGYIQAGGEVADWSSTNHDEMGIVNFTNLKYQQNHQPWVDWSGWDYTHTDYEYRLTRTSGNAFQICGYNCGGGGGGT